ncbi:ferredoxin-type protein NapF [Thauera butanivorans]|uniref:ferredoxin-type protein NapF n=1 Tax=Thauera butanivorans TaxID=86174 RepID=UPI0009FEC768|nr:ferredoxin-type protein NapF [Thauera butanivorans]
MQTASLSRRSFLRGGMRAVAPAVRPPWARAEAAFLAACTRCDACIDACPTAILLRADGGFPGVDFSAGAGECTFCGECVAHCEPQALVRSAEGGAPWALKAGVGRGCLAESGVECRVCGESCPVGAIRFRPRLGGVALPQLDADACTGCGACFAPCPTRAIAMTVDRVANEFPTESER